MRLKLKLLWFIRVVLIFTLLSATLISQSQDISSLSPVFWYRSDSVRISGGSSVDTLYDLSGNNYHCYQTSSSKMPNFIDNVINGVPIISFTQSTSMIIKDLVVDVSKPYIVICVIDNQFSGDAVSVFMELSTNNSSSIKFMLPTGSWESSYGTVAMGSRNGIPYKLIKTNEPINFNSFNYITFGYDGIELTSLSSYNFIGNNTYLMPNTGSNVLASNDNLLGKEGSTWGFEGDIAEIIMFDNTLSSGDSTVIANYIKNKYIPELDFGVDINKESFCEDTLIVYSELYSNYQWNTGSVNDTLIVNETGYYSVTITDIFGFTSSDSIYIEFLGDISTYNDSIVCTNDGLWIDTKLSSSLYSFNWSGGQTDSAIYVKQGEVVSLTITDNNGCNRIQSITIPENNFPIEASLGIDKDLCSGNTIALEIGKDETEFYQWSTGATTDNITITTTNDYSLTATNSIGCVAIDTIFVNIIGDAPVAQFTSDTVCLGDTTHFTDLSYTTDGSNIVNWQWLMSTEPVEVSVPHPSYVFENDSLQIVFLTVTTDVGCGQIVTDSVWVYPVPKSIFTIPNLVCFDDSIWLFSESKVLDSNVASIKWLLDGVTLFQNIDSIELKITGDNLNVELQIIDSKGCYHDTLIKVQMSQKYKCLDVISLSPLLWYRSDSVHISSGTSIDTLYDLSGNNYHCSQPLLSKMPNYSSGVLNGQSVVTFSQSTSMTIKDMVVDVSKPYTMICIIDNQFSGDAVSVFMELSTTSTSSQKFMLPVGSWESSYGTIASGSASGTPYKLVKSNVPINNGTFNYLILTFEGTGLTSLSNYKFNVNNSNLSTSMGSNVLVSNDNLLGKEGGTWGFEGQIAEILYFDKLLSQSDSVIISDYLKSKYIPKLELGEDRYKVTFCADTLIAYSSLYTDYLWNNGSTNDTLIVSETGTYSVTVTDIFGFTSTDSIYIEFPGDLSTYNDSIVCSNDSLLIATKLSSSIYTFSWSSGETDSAIYVNEGSIIDLTITDNNSCTLIQSVTITEDSFPQLATLGPDLNLCSGNTIALTQGASEATSYQWSTSITTPQAIITATGDYSVTVTSTNGCTATDTIHVNIIGVAPIAQFTSDTVCLGDTTHFTDLSFTTDGSSIVSYQWNFASTSSATSNLESPIFNFQEDSLHLISLSITTDAGCGQIFTDSVWVYPLPQPDFNFIVSEFCSGEKYPVLLEGNDLTNQNTTFEWTFENVGQAGFDTTGTDSTYHVFETKGDFNTRLVLISEHGCTDTLIKPISIFETPKPDFVVQPSCEGDSTVLLDNTPNAKTNWNWDWFVTDMFTSISNDPIVKYIYENGGDYTITMTVSTENNCSDTIVKQVFIPTKPTADFSPTDFCINTPLAIGDSSVAENSEIIKWDWDINNYSFESQVKSPKLNFENNKEGDFFTMQLIVTSREGCKDSVTKVVKIHTDPKADFIMSPEYGQPPLDVQFTNLSTGATNYSWSFGNGDSSLLKNPLYTYVDSNNYQIKLVVANNFGCMDSASKSIKVLLPKLDIAINAANSYIENNQFLIIEAQMVNMGTRRINSADVYLLTSDEQRIREQWVGEMRTNDRINYTFNASFDITQQTTPDYICVRVENPNGEQDENDSNNQVCLTFTGFKVFDPYPNPVTNELFVLFTLPEKASVFVSLINDLGQEIAVLFNGTASKGLNKLNFDTKSLRNGTYSLRVVKGEEVIVKKVVKF